MHVDSEFARVSTRSRAFGWLLVAAMAVTTACARRADERRADQRSAALSPATTTNSVNAGSSTVAKRGRQHRLDVTFFVASDTHLGFDVPLDGKRDIVRSPIGIERTNLRMIRSMNEAPTREFPGAVRGKVSPPRGVLITGDLTEHGGAVEWAMFEQMYGRSGKGGPLVYPVFEADGNHDRALDWHVRDQIAKRHGGRYYSFDWDDLHLVCLAEAPADDGIDFLEKDLAPLADDVPLILYMHYPLSGPYSNNWWSQQNGPEKLARVIAGRNVVGIFHGHHHASGAYRWEGYDVYNVGSPKNDFRTYLVVRAKDDQMVVAAYNYETNDWWWWHQKPINEGTGERRFWVKDPEAGVPQPKVNL